MIMGTGQVKRAIEQSLSLIVTGRQSEVIQEWEKLKKLDHNHVCQQVINCEDILRNVLRLPILNIHELPNIMDWIAKYLTKKPADFNPIVNDIAMFLKHSRLEDINHLAVILQTLLNNKVYLSEYGNYSGLCEAIVINLSSFQMPAEPQKIIEFHYDAAKIKDFLETIISNVKNVENDDLMFTCLKTLYRIISDKNLIIEPGPGLAAVLQLVEPSFIPQPVNWILSESQCDEQLIQALKVLCTWFPKWNEDRLGTWIMEFIWGLEKQHNYAILIEVSEATLDIMLLALAKPLLRQNACNIIFHILKRQGSPSLIPSIIKNVDIILPRLIQEDSESSKECIQNLVDIMKALLTRFPEYSKDYTSLQNNFPVQYRMRIVREIYTGPIWANEKQLEPIIESPKSKSGKVGLSNLGNTCYMNSVLQALLMTREFCQEVLNYKPSNENGEQIILKKLQNLFALLLYSKRISLAPTEILLVSRPAYFLPWEQQDSSEFLCHLLDMLEEQEKSGGNETATNLKCKMQEQVSDGDLLLEETNGSIKRWTTEEDLTGGIALQRKTQSLADFTQGEELTQTQHLSDSHSDSTDSGIQSVGGEESNMQASLVHRVLGGESKITYQCAQCDTSSHNTDKFRDLQLCFPEEIQENQEVSVQDLINYYLTPEKLTGENKYRCDKCTKLCDAQRIIKILQAPAHLILILKHFRYDFDTRLRTKLRHKVMYNNTIQLPVSAHSNTIPETYQLYAAVVHSGYSMDYGHYFTYACDSKQNWYKFNDSYVSQTSLDDFKSLKPPDTPYILFYEKLGCSNGIYEEDKPELSTLSKHLQEIVANDTTTYMEKLRRTQQNRYPKSFLRRSDNSDDENPPPSSCRGAVNIQANQFLC